MVMFFDVFVFLVTTVGSSVAVSGGDPGASSASARDENKRLLWLDRFTFFLIFEGICLC